MREEFSGEGTRFIARRGEFVVEYVLGRSGLGRGEVIERRQRLVRGQPLLGVIAQSSSKAMESSGSFLIGALSLIGRPSG